MDQMKSKITEELDSRIARLEEHQGDRIVPTGNRYDELNQALAKVIGAPLLDELKDVRNFVERL